MGGTIHGAASYAECECQSVGYGRARNAQANERMA